MRRDKEDRATDHLRYVFGPVASGRLGLSLGLDGLGGRICSFDCLYCEAGPTEALTRTRKPYAPACRLLDELATGSPGAHLPDVVTLGGMGEPTLNTECGAILAGAKELFPGLSTAVLTNSSLLSDPTFGRTSPWPILFCRPWTAWSKLNFFRLNRPHPDLSWRHPAGAARFSRRLCGPDLSRDPACGRCQRHRGKFGPAAGLLPGARSRPGGRHHHVPSRGPCRRRACATRHPGPVSGGPGRGNRFGLHCGPWPGGRARRRCDGRTCGPYRRFRQTAPPDRPGPGPGPRRPLEQIQRALQALARAGTVRREVLGHDTFYSG